MSDVSVSENHDTITISVKDRFDFAKHRAFRDSYRNSPKSAKFVLQMREVNYIDSSALGMMLILREHAMKHRSDKVKIIGCNPEIRKILTIANFNQMFDIE